MTNRLIVTLSILFMIATTVACKPQKQIITEKETKTEVVDKPIIHEIYKANTVRDTVWNKDSVFIIQRGDTIYNTSIREFHHYTHTTDTIHSNDTITKVVVQPVEKIIREKVEVEVEKKISNWQKFRMMMGDFALGAIAVLLGIGIIYFVRKQKLV